ncbi:MAG: hypothetical protein ACRD1Z_01055, partial [Vicinamibacteria bacterium]
MLGFHRFNSLRTVLGGEIHETPPPPTLGSLRGSRTTLRQIEEGLDFASRDPKIRSLLIFIRPLNVGWSRIDSLRASLERFRESGKKVIAYFEGAGNKEYYLASACDEIW